MLAGVSTLGILFGYAVETIAGQKPSAFTLLNRINSIGGVSLSTEQIDASALEDLISRYVAGRQDTGGTWSVTVNLTDETAEEWKTLISAAKTGEESGLSTWFEVYSPMMTDAFFVVAQPPKDIPLPEIGQNGLFTVEMTLTISDYKGLDTAIKPTAAVVPGP